ncbi:hypothetical protein [Methylobacterium nigriterrae]|uniref:hypothetical protein n=1 Tax=Methylobacterium nigriterrae TaxID=3127512 RepID=UPI0030132F64
MGNAILFAGEDESFQVGAREEIEAALAAGAGSMLLATDSDEQLGLRFVFDDFDQALAATDRMGPPSLILQDAASETFVLIYLLDEPVPAGDPRQAVFADVVGRATESAVQDVPLLGGAGGWEPASDATEAALAGGDMITYPFGELIGKCMTPAPERVAARSNLPVQTVREDSIPAPGYADLPRHADAILHGDLAEELLGQEITIAFAPNREAKKWPNSTLTLGQFVNLMAKHQVGDKDGKSFLTGETIDKVRSKSAIRAMHLLGVDVDCGLDLAPVIERAKEKGLFTIIYTTHSHLKTTTEISQTQFTNWARKEKRDTEVTAEGVRDYLVVVRAYTPATADTITDVRVQHTGKGMQILVEHAPMSKFRAILALDAPFVFAEQTGSHQEAMKAWGRKIRGVSRMLGAPVDESTLDPSRLFYLPRHAKGAAHETHVIAGRLLDLGEVEEAATGASFVEEDAFAALGAEMAGVDVIDHTGTVTRTGFDVQAWKRERGEHFELATLFEDTAAERVRHREAGKITVECPFDGEHSNPGDEEDMGCFVSNASDNPQQTGYVFKCSHNSCAGRTKVQMLCEAFDQGWLQEADFTNPDYSCRVDEVASGEDHQPLQATRTAAQRLLALREEIESYTPSTAPHLIDQALRRLAECGASTIERSDILARLKVRTKKSKGELQEAFKEVQRRLRSEKREHVWKIEPPIEPGGPPRVVIPSHLGYARAYEKCLEIMNAANDARPELFRTGMTISRISYNSLLDEIQVQSVDEHMLAERLYWRTIFIKEANDGAVTEDPASIRLVKQLMADQRLELPPLVGLATNPFFAESGALVTASGYHWESGIYLRLSRGLSELKPPANPTPQDVQEALSFIFDNIYVDFPFDDGPTAGGGHSSRAHSLCLLLQFFMRPMIAGPTPIYLLTKPAPGTGAGLLMNGTLYTATGSEAQAQSVSSSREEMRKLITTKLLAAVPYVWFDNVSEALNSGELASAITSQVWTDRRLGANDDIRVPIRSGWIIAGNNPKLSPELARRCVPIRIDAKGDPCDRPKPFKHQDLQGWVVANRSELVHAALTVIKYWVDQGMPRSQAKPLASFEEWSAVMGGVLETAGVKGFLGNLNLMREQTDEQNGAVAALLQHWIERGDFQEMRPIGNPEDHNTKNRAFSGEMSLVSLVHEHGLDIDLPSYDGRRQTMQLSKLLSGLKDNVFRLKVNGAERQVTLRTGMHKGSNTKGFCLEVAG